MKPPRNEYEARASLRLVERPSVRSSAPRPHPLSAWQHLIEIIRRRCAGGN